MHIIINTGGGMRFLFVVLTVVVFSTVLPFSQVSAQTIEYSGFNVFLGAVIPEDWDTGFNIGAGVCLGEVLESIFLYPSLSYWEATSGDLGSASEDAGLSNISVAVDAHYHFTGTQEGLYTGTGISYNILSWDYAYSAYVPHRVTYWAEDSDQKIGFQPLVGYNMDFDRFSGFVELKYNLISDFNTVQLSLGALFGK